MARKAVVVRESAASVVPFVASRGMREYLRCRLENSRGTVEEHAVAAGVHRATVHRWWKDGRFAAWVSGEEMRALKGFVGPVMLRAKEIALGAEDEEVALKAVDVVMRHMPGKVGEGDVAMRAVLQSLMRPGPAVQVNVGVPSSAAVLPSAGVALEREAMAAGVMSMTRTVGAALPVQGATVEVIKAVPVEVPGPEVPHVVAAMRELEELAAESNGKEIPDGKEIPADPWAGVRRGKVEEVTPPWEEDGDG